MTWVDYGGQSTDGYDAIGTDDLKYPITPTMDLEATLAELERRCGRLARVKLFKRRDPSEVDAG